MLYLSNAPLKKNNNKKSISVEVNLGAGSWAIRLNSLSPYNGNSTK